MVSRPKTPRHSSSSTNEQRQQKSLASSFSNDAASSIMPPLLVELIETQQFEKAIALVRDIPTEASLTMQGNAHNSIMGQGNLALHEACKNQPTIELIDALLEANESAVRTKGHWGYLPLHFACCSRASPEVVARLIVTYPSATRTKDDHEGTLPLHLASKWGADDEVIMALLTVHPKASGVRDSSGRTPLEHATQLTSPHAREAVLQALRRAPILCAVSKAAMNKLAYEGDAKLREVVEIYQERMTQVKEKYEQDKTNAVALEVQLRKELWDKKERSSNLSEKLVRLSRALEEKTTELEEKGELLEQIQGLISGRLKATREREEQNADARDDAEHSPREPSSRDAARAKRKDQQTLAKSAVREWVAAGSSESSDQSGDETEVEERDPPPSSAPPSPRQQPPADGSTKSAAVATVKEWISSANTSQLSEEEPRRPTTHRPSSRDKIEHYRQPHHQSSQRPVDHTSSAVRKQSQDRTPCTPHGNDDDSLLHRSKDAPRSRAVLARREMATRIPTPTQNPSPDYSRSHSGSIRHKTPGKDRIHRQQQPPEPAQPQHRLGHQYQRSTGMSNSYSTSSRYTATQTSHRSSLGSPRQQPVSQSYSASSSTRRYESKLPGGARPRESYSVQKPATSAYSHRIMDDADETLTMDSKIEWE